MFQDTVWWVTGASSGIGAALSEALGKLGAKLILSGRNETALDGVASRIDSDTLVLPFDVTDLDGIPAIADRALDWATARGGLYGLVNNAGVSQRSLAVDTVFSVYESIIAIDLLAPIALSQAVLPHMVTAGKGQLVSMSSVAGIVGTPLRSAYSAAKHGLIGYSDSVRAENEIHGVKVLVVAPGSIKTNISRNALTTQASKRGESDAAIENGLSPEEAVDQIISALESGQRELIIARGMEAEIAKLRRSDPNALFDRMADMIANGYATQMKAS